MYLDYESILINIRTLWSKFMSMNMPNRMFICMLCTYNAKNKMCIMHWKILNQLSYDTPDLICKILFICRCNFHHDLSYSTYTNKYHFMIRYNYVHTLGFSIDGNKCTKNRNSIDHRNRLNLQQYIFLCCCLCFRLRRNWWWSLFYNNVGWSKKGQCLVLPSK